MRRRVHRAARVAPGPVAVRLLRAATVAAVLVTPVAVVTVRAVDAGEQAPSRTSQRMTFRSGVTSVSVNVSVKHGNVPAPGLTADDFRLTDNGVPQTVTAVAIEAVPIDVTIFHDTSPSQGGRLDELKDDVRRIAAMLRPGDRFRLLVFGRDRQVNDVVGWQPAGTELDLDAIAIAPVSPVHDAVLAALMHRPDVGRRHLVVALTDGIDAGGMVSSWSVRDAAARAEAVLHLVRLGSSHDSADHGAGYWNPSGVEPGGDDRLVEAAELTGGQKHDKLFGSPDPVEAFERIFADFRASYVLHYTPTGVADEGWHEIEVIVPSTPRATVRARRGYFGG